MTENRSDDAVCTLCYMHGKNSCDCAPERMRLRVLIERLKSIAEPLDGKLELIGRNTDVIALRLQRAIIELQQVHELPKDIKGHEVMTQALQGDTFGHIRMYADNLVVRFDHLTKEERRSHGGIILPESKKGKEEPALATVLACGPGWYPGTRCSNCGAHNVTESKHFDEMPCKVGDRVLVESALSGDVLMTDEHEELRIIRAANVIAVVEE